MTEDKGSVAAQPPSVTASPFAALRSKAERYIVLNRDECLALVEVAELAHAYQAEMESVAYEWRMDLVNREAFASKQLFSALCRLCSALTTDDVSSSPEVKP